MDSIELRKKESREYLREGDVEMIAKQANVKVNSVYNYTAGRVAHSAVAPFYEALIALRKKQVSQKIKDMVDQANKGD